MAQASDQNKYEAALQALGKIAYKETGLELRVKEIEKESIPKPFKKYGGYTILIADIVVNQRIKYEWEF